MLHSALPRAFLAPGLSYLGGYYSEDVHPYTAASTYIPIEDPYARAAETHVFPSWQPHRSATPCPLDLSLKPPPASSTPKTEESLGEAIEVDDDEDRRSRDEVQRRLENPRYIHDNDDVSPGNEVVGLHHRSVHHIYDQLLLQKDQRHTILEDHEEKSKIHQDNIRLQESPLSYASTEIPQMNSLKYNLTGQKMPMTSPTRLQSMQNYHQQLLLTPQQHLQGIHAPMTPPSTPSPPQCPRRRAREEEVISPSTTPKQAIAVEKPAQRPKKKHARRLKFDEDTSSPVSGTVILGPDEAVVTGDIDPAFNIVEVTEEARAELAKIENRLGPYQCKLCRQLHEDAFQLAQHRCSRIAHVEYRCPECDKRFSCPANLASHRRWHKPRLPNGENGNGSPATEISCTRCDAKFTRQAALRKHMSSQHLENNCSSALSPQEHSSASPKLPGASNAVPLAASPLQTEVP